MASQKQTEMDKKIGEIFFAYLKRILYRTARDYIRCENTRRTRTVSMDELRPYEQDICYLGREQCVHPTKSSYYLYIEDELLAERIPNLDEAERELLFFLFFDEMTTTEAAELLGISQQAVSKRKRKLIGKLNYGA